MVYHFRHICMSFYWVFHNFGNGTHFNHFEYFSGNKLIWAKLYHGEITKLANQFVKSYSQMGIWDMNIGGDKFIMAYHWLLVTLLGLANCTTWCTLLSMLKRTMRILYKAIYDISTVWYVDVMSCKWWKCCTQKPFTGTDLCGPETARK